MLRPERSARSRTLVRVSSLLASFLILAGSALAQAPSPPYRSGEILIKFAPGTSAADIAAIEQSLGASVITNYATIGASHQRITALSVEQAISRYRGDPRVRY